MRHDKGRTRERFQVGVLKMTDEEFRAACELTRPTWDSVSNRTKGDIPKGKVLLQQEKRPK